MRYSEIRESETLTELVGVKKFHDMTVPDIIRYLDDKFKYTPNSNVKVLGRGASGTAVMIDGVVYKFWLNDSAYTAFIQYALKNQSNPCLPKFLSGIKTMPAFFLRHEDAPDAVNYIKMEKLTFNSQIMGKLYWITDTNGGGHSINLQRVCQAAFYLLPSSDPIDGLTKMLIEDFDVGFESKDLPDDLILIMKTLWDIKTIASVKNHMLDLHAANFMFRDDQVVILDPILNSDDLDLNRQFTSFDEKLFRKETDGKKAITSVRSSAKDMP